MIHGRQGIPQHRCRLLLGKTAAPRDLDGSHFHILPIIGDGALSGGMAMRHLIKSVVSSGDMIIIFLDNNMSISKMSVPWTRLLQDLGQVVLIRT